MLKVHFLNVGKGCCAVVEFATERLGVIDIDDSQSFSEEVARHVAEYLNIDGIFLRYRSMVAEQKAHAIQLVEKGYKRAGRELTDPVSYIQDLPYDKTFRFILTHPDMDHMSGIKRLHESRPFINLWDTDNNRTIDPDSWSQGGYHKYDWNTYQELRESSNLPKALRLTRGARGQYYDEDQIEILSPTPELVRKANDSEKYNHLSYVLRISYKGKSIILGGDATPEAWDDIYEEYGDDLACDVLLASHHGSTSGFHKEAIGAMNPSLVIVSVQTGTDYAYDQYSAIAGTVISTRWRGNIVIEIDILGNLAYETQFD